MNSVPVPSILVPKHGNPKDSRKIPKIPKITNMGKIMQGMSKRYA